MHLVMYLLLWLKIAFFHELFENVERLCQMRLLATYVLSNRVAVHHSWCSSPCNVERATGEHNLWFHLILINFNCLMKLVATVLDSVGKREDMVKAIIDNGFCLGSELGSLIIPSASYPVPSVRGHLCVPVTVYVNISLSSPSTHWASQSIIIL